MSPSIRTATRKWRSRLTITRGVVRTASKMMSVERKEGSLRKTIKATRANKDLSFENDWNYGELIEWAAQKYGPKLFLEYREQSFSFSFFNMEVNKVVRNLQRSGLSCGDGVALMMTNHPDFLKIFFATQKLGLYVVPVNAGLIGEGLSYIINHSEVKALVLDGTTLDPYLAVADQCSRLEHVWISTEEAESSLVLPHSVIDFKALTCRGENGAELELLDNHKKPDLEQPSMLLYTSGTTGLPKAVVTTYGNTGLKKIGLMANILYNKSDKIYTCLPLFHANALLMSLVSSLWVGIPLVVSKRFSASNFWREISKSGATSFNTVGGMIPILLKTPVTLYDTCHKVKRIVSAACPGDVWEEFENRYGVDIWEAYGAVDGGGAAIMNFGNGPVGSLGKPPSMLEYKLADAAGNDVGVDEPGEFMVNVADKKESQVRYFKNEKASNEKVKNGWLHSGDLMRRDRKGFLYFVGRNSDSMRRMGENVSAYEVEKQVDGHPAILESAAFGVPSEMGEEEIMICVTLVKGKDFDAKEFASYLKEKLPKYALPTFMDVLDELPKTGTHRVIKADLKKQGVSKKTIQLETRVARK